jgi:hypothetical protein
MAVGQVLDDAGGIGQAVHDLDQQDAGTVTVDRTCMAARFRSGK